MTENEPRRPSGHDIDADIVCAGCGLENEHGTLICRQCGTNLRDQRRNRLAEMAAGLETEHKASRRRLLSGLLSVFGIVAILGVTFNLDAIATYLAGGGSEGRATSESYWRGPMGATFAEMIADLENNPPSDSARASAIAAPRSGAGLTGRYVLLVPGATANAEVGIASIQEKDGATYFCALLDGGGEVRGLSKVDDAGRMTTDHGVVEFRGVRLAGVGYAARNAQGGFTVYGASFSEDGGQFEVMAFPIAEPAEG